MCINRLAALEAHTAVVARSREHPLEVGRGVGERNTAVAGPPYWPF